MFLRRHGEKERLVGVTLDSARDPQVRTIRDASGTLWQAGERDARDVPGAMASHCLVFDSQAICRRYWSYPADWYDLTDAALLDVMNQPRHTVR